jgi:dGTPase
MDGYLQDSAYGTAPYATKAAETRGRLVAEPRSATRTEFQRDRDRIVHSGAFRKLRNKTQVFIENEGDYYRTRLTHSLEVAQIARSVARALRVDEDLTEAIALAHDLGHTCFGHAGEDGLAEAMAPYGGFSHNEQTFRILTKLEHRYARFDGLNLTWETLEGVVKHNGPVQLDKLPATVKDFCSEWDLEINSYAGIEAQIAAIADDTAYNTHDIDDGHRAGFFRLEDLKELPLFGAALAGMEARYVGVDRARLMHETVREVVGLLVTDLLDTTRKNLQLIQPQSAVEVRHASKAIVGFSEGMQANVNVLRGFLARRMYQHSKVNRICAKARMIVKDLFAYLWAEPQCLPNAWHELVKIAPNENAKARLIADYIAGMTDRFAVQEHRKLFSTETML